MGADHIVGIRKRFAETCRNLLSYCSLAAGRHAAEDYVAAAAKQPPVQLLRHTGAISLVQKQFRGPDGLGYKHHQTTFSRDSACLRIQYQFSTYGIVYAVQHIAKMRQSAYIERLSLHAGIHANRSGVYKHLAIFKTGRIFNRQPVRAKAVTYGKNNLRGSGFTRCSGNGL